MITTSVICGLIWSLMWIVYVYILVKKYPWSMLHDYPKDIQEASTMPEPSDRALRESKIVSGLIGTIIIIVAIIMTYACVGSEGSWLDCFISSFIIVIAWNVVDLIFMDWLLFCTINPKWMVIEGTENCKGYKDYFFHFKGFLIGCVYSLISALVIGTITFLV